MKHEFDHFGYNVRMSSHKQTMEMPAFLYATVLVMGAIGATLRYLIELVLPTNGFPFGTLLINLVGCYIIYVVYQWFDRRLHIPHPIARGIGVGLVGAFTTLSAFCTENLVLLQAGDYLTFALYVSATVFGTFVASLAGWATCSLLAYRRLKHLQRRRIEHHLEMQRAKQAAVQDVSISHSSESDAKPSLPDQPTSPEGKGAPSEGRRS